MIDVRDLRIAVVMLTWNDRRHALSCLASLSGQLTRRDVVIVADNGSTDGTEEAIRAAFPDVLVVQNGANLGFAGGNNPGLRRALELGVDWVFVLNNDTVLPDGALAALREHAAAAPPVVGALQPVLVRGDRPEVVDTAGHALNRLPGVRDLAAGSPVERLPDRRVPVFGACAAAALVRREALLEAGLFDTALFVLFEDVDLMFRVRAAGFDVLSLPEVRIRHARGVSGDRRRGDALARARRRYWAQRNILALALRWWPAWSLVVGAPVLIYRAAVALALARRHDLEPCWPLWRDSARDRAANRAAMRQHGVDRWFGRRSAD